MVDMLPPRRSARVRYESAEARIRDSDSRMRASAPTSSQEVSSSREIVLIPLSLPNGNSRAT